MTTDKKKIASPYKAYKKSDKYKAYKKAYYQRKKLEVKESVK